MDALTCLLTRRSVRRYSDQPVSRPLVEDIIRYAMYAPSAKNTRPWHFVVIDKRELLEAVADFHPHAKMLLTAPCAVAVCGDETESDTPEYWPIDCAAAAQNLLLAAHAQGLGTVWLGIYPRPERMENLSELLSLPPHIHPLTLVALGYPEKEMPAVSDRFDPNRVHFNGF